MQSMAARKHVCIVRLANNCISLYYSTVTANTPLGRLETHATEHTSKGYGTTKMAHSATDSLLDLRSSVDRHPLQQQFRPPLPPLAPA